MPLASDIEPVAQGISLWSVYDPAVKADLFSTAIATVSGIFLIDPVLLAPGALASLRAQGKIAGIIVTNDNHLRGAAGFSDQFEVPIFLHAGVTAIATPRVQRIGNRERFAPGLTAIEIEGGPPGEIAVYSEAANGTLVIGDALINFEPYGFALLPAKYCASARAMRRSLPKLLDYSFQRILFAHGTPILRDARHRLEQLLVER